jgi:hypothetical protein
MFIPWWPARSVHGLVSRSTSRRISRFSLVKAGATKQDGLSKGEIMSTDDSRDKVRELLFTLSCEDQFWLATAVAENVGYVLVPEKEIRNPEIIWIDGERYKLIAEDIT